MKSVMREMLKTIVYFYSAFCFYTIKVDDRVVVLESKQGDDLDSNMFSLLQELNERQKDNEQIRRKIYPKICLVVNGSSKKRIRNLLESYNIKKVKYLRRNSFNYCRMLSRAKYLFNDTSFPYFFTKKKEQVYVNTWHGTPLKKMGNDLTIGKLSQGNVKRNFMMSDFILFPNVEMEEKMSAAYGLDELYQGKVINSGYPRNSILLSQEKEDEIRKKLKLSNKKVLVYMPTHRGIVGVNQYKGQVDDIEGMLKYLDSHLKDDEILFVSVHSFVREKLDVSAYAKVRPFPATVDSYELLSCADVLITDYSSVMFDFLNTGKKIILYTYDYDEYLKRRGMYYDLCDFPFAKANNEHELLAEIRNDAEFDYSSLSERFTTYDSVSAAQNLLEFIFDKKDEGVRVKNLEGNGKQNTLFYVGNLNLNGITSSVVNLLSVADTSSENIFYCVKQSHFEQQPDKILVLPEDAKVVPLFDKLRPSFLEGIALLLTYKFDIETRATARLLSRMFERESYRLLGGLRLDRAIQYTGYDLGVIGIFEKLKAQRAIFVHNDMVKEHQTKGNVNPKMFKHFYSSFDRVACVSLAAYDSVIKISGRRDNIRMVQNAIDAKTIKEKALREPQFDEITSSTHDLDAVVDVLEGDCIKFINIARFSPEKGHKRLINAFNEFYKSNRNSYLIIIGGYSLDGLYESLIQYAASLEARDNIILIKKLKNPYPFLKKSSCFAFSSFYEGLGIVLLEAAVLDVPLFSTNIQGPRELLQLYGGTLVEDSQAGIVEGMTAYSNQEIKSLDFDYATYNKKVAEEFGDLFN